jgi:hypothetical protein
VSRFGRSAGAPAYTEKQSVAPLPRGAHRLKAPSNLDPFMKEIERLLRFDHRMPGTRIRELIAELG